MKKIVLFLSAFCFFTPVSAQDFSGYQEQLDALKEEMVILQRKVYRDSIDNPNSGSAVAQFTQYDQTVRDMNGKIDTLEHQLKVLEDKVNAMNNDIDVRFKLLEGKPIPAATGSLKTPQKFDAAVAKDAPKAVVGDDVSSGGLKDLQPEKKASAEELYQMGLEALKANDSQKSAQMFNLILEKYPEDKLAGNAQYWLGEVYYKDKDFTRAAVAFGKGYEQYKNGAKGADSLLKLGFTMDQLGRKEEACVALTNLPKEFPNAEKSILDKAAEQAKKSGCQ